MQRYSIDIDSLIYPLFIKEGSRIREPIISMPGINRYSVDTILGEIEILYRLGIRNFLLFGMSSMRDNYTTIAYKNGSLIANTVKTIRKDFSDITLFTDVCLCAYTAHGHCGILKDDEKVLVDEEATLKALSEMALRHAEAGADYVAPSAMARDQVKAIRAKLDANGCENTKVMGYSAKFASNFYGPFRDAAGSTPSFGNRSSYQLGYKNPDEALSEIADDIKEGADIVMIKPALAYLDIINRARNAFDVKLAAYNVSGEYAMVKSGTKAGYWKEKDIVFEILASIYRAGADIVITYHARDIAEWVQKEAVIAKV